MRFRCHATDDHSTGKKKTSAGGLRVKKKLCWFNENHPDGCPVEAECCSRAHGDCDLAVD